MYPCLAEGAGLRCHSLFGKFQKVFPIFALRQIPATMNGCIKCLCTIVYTFVKY